METVLNVLAAFTVGAIVTLGATVSQQQERLCTAMGGTYQASGPDRCPDGKWTNIFRKTPTPQH